jgi:hypothetical protein
MAFTTPRTWVTAEMVTAALLNTYVRDNLQSVRDQVTARIRGSAAGGNLLIPNNAETRVGMDTTDFDSTGTIADLVNDRLVFPVSGKYIVGGNARWAVNATGHREIRIVYHDSVANADSRITITASEAAAGVAPCLSTDTTFDCKAGDYVYLTAYQNSGGGLNITPLDSADPVLYTAREGI